MNIEHYQEQFRTLNVDTSKGHNSPHKPCMLLAILELVESGAVTENRFEFNDVLIQRYAKYFEVVRVEPDRLNPWLPFFHLSRDHVDGHYFWNHNPVGERGAVLQAMKTASSRRDIVDNIDYVELPASLFALMEAPDDRAVLREILITVWFPHLGAVLRNLIDEVQHSSVYERSLRGLEEEKHAREPLADIAARARSAAFRQVVLDAYDFRCAATGVRFLLPDSTAMVEAAHLIPFSETADDSPTNGIALSPDMHWAMDRNIIAPGPDLKWHVAKFIDPRIPDYKPLASLDGVRVFVPNNPEFGPREDALNWRLAHLMAAENY